MTLPAARHFECTGKGPHTIQFSADGSLLLGASYHAMDVWDVRSAKKVCEYRTARGRSFIAAALSSNGRRAVTAGDVDGSIELWDVATCSVTASIPIGPEMKVTSLELLADAVIWLEKSVERHGIDQLKLWNPAGGATQILESSRGLADLTVDRAGHCSYVADGGILMRIELGKEIRALPRLVAGSGAGILNISNDGEWLGVTIGDLGVAMMPVRAPHRWSFIPLHHADSLAISPDGSTIAVVENETLYFVRNAVHDNGNPEAGEMELIDQIGCVRLRGTIAGKRLLTYHPDGALVAVADRAGVKLIAAPA